MEDNDAEMVTEGFQGEYIHRSDGIFDNVYSLQAVGMRTNRFLGEEIQKLEN